MKHSQLTSLLVVIVAILCSCNKDSTIDQQLSFKTENLSVGAEYGAYSIEVDAGRIDNWQVEVGEDCQEWVYLIGSEGSILKIEVQRNTTLNERSGWIRVSANGKSDYLTIKQAPRTDYLHLPFSEYSAKKYGEKFQIEVLVNFDDLGVSVGDSQEYLKLVKPQILGPNGGYIFTFEIKANVTTPDDRVAYIEFFAEGNLDTKAKVKIIQPTAFERISSESDLIALRDAVFEGKTPVLACLTQDITLTQAWTPMGDNDYPFSGVLDGNGFRISGINIDKGTANNIGFIGVSSLTYQIRSTYESEVKNLTLSGTVCGKNDVGGFCGKGGIALINCVNEINVKGMGDGVGGFIGNGKEITVSGCINKGSVIGEYDAAGIVDDCLYGEIEKSSNQGVITSKHECSGLVNDCSSSSVNECHNSGAIYGIGNSAWAAGLIGESLYSHIINSYNEGSVGGENGSACGLVRRVFSRPSGTKLYSLLNCYNKGQITGINACGIAERIESEAFVAYCFDVSGVRPYAFLGEYTFESCYYLKPSTLVFEDLSRKCQGKTEQEMKTLATYVGWKFFGTKDQPWKMTEGNYPFLYWE